LGQATGLTANHLIQNESAAGYTLKIQNNDVTSTANGLQVKVGNGNAGQTIFKLSNLADNNDYFIVKGDGATYFGSSTASYSGTIGANSSWFFGTPTATIQHKFVGGKHATTKHVLAIRDNTADAVGVGGGLLFTGYYTSSEYEAASIESYKEATGTNSYGTTLNFYTAAQTTGTMTKRMTLTSNTYLGINNASPVARIHMRTSNTSSTTLSAFIIENTSSGSFALDITGTAGASVLNFRTSGSPGNYTADLASCGTIECETNPGSWTIGPSSGSTTVTHTLHVNTSGFGININQRSSGSNGLLFSHSGTQYGAIIFSSASDFSIRGSTSTSLLVIDDNGRMTIGKSGAAAQDLEFVNINVTNPLPSFISYIKVIVNGNARYIPIYG
jgi:hypothetical protein